MAFCHELDSVRLVSTRHVFSLSTGLSHSLPVQFLGSILRFQESRVELKIWHQQTAGHWLVRDKYESVSFTRIKPAILKNSLQHLFFSTVQTFSPWYFEEVQTFLCLLADNKIQRMQDQMISIYELWLAKGRWPWLDQSFWKLWQTMEIIWFYLIY